MTQEPETQNIGDYGVSWIRTFVPIAWGGFLTWLSGRIPCIADFLHSAPVASLSVGIAGVLGGIWYGFWRKFENKLPPWATRIVLGANKQPIYVNPEKNTEK